MAASKDSVRGGSGGRRRSRIRRRSPPPLLGRAVNLPFMAEIAVQPSPVETVEAIYAEAVAAVGEDSYGVLSDDDTYAFLYAQSQCETPVY